MSLYSRSCCAQPRTTLPAYRPAAQRRAEVGHATRGRQRTWLTNDLERRPTGDSVHAGRQNRGEARLRQWPTGGQGQMSSWRCAPVVNEMCIQCDTQRRRRSTTSRRHSSLGAAAKQRAAPQQALGASSHKPPECSLPPPVCCSSTAKNHAGKRRGAYLAQENLQTARPPSRKRRERATLMQHMAGLSGATHPGQGSVGTKAGLTHYL